MKEIHPLRKLIFVLLIFFTGRACAGTIESGSHTLELTIPGMVVAAGKPYTEFTGKIKSEGDTFQFETKGTTGNPVTIHGKLVDERVLMWMTIEEKGNLETFHFIGEFSKDKVVVASGELSLFSKHDKAAAGKWKLRTIK